MAYALGTDLGATVVPEQLRRFVDEHRRTPTQAEQPAIFHAQRDALREAVQATNPGGVVVGDPAALMTAIYSIQYFDDDSLLPTALEAIVDTDLLVWCQPDFPWSADGLHHDGPDARERTHAIIEHSIVPALANTRLLIVDGSLAARVARVRAAVDR